MKLQGYIELWQAQKGYGFIRSSGTRYFFHIRGFRASPQALASGLEVEFEAIQVGGKGPRAMAVSPLRPLPPLPPKFAPRRGSSNPPPHAMQSSRRSLPTGQRTSASKGPRSGEARSAQFQLDAGLPLMVIWLALIAIGFFKHRLAFWVAPGLLLLNLFTFWAYWQDKFAARQNQWRTKEQTLHLLALIGGWPCAWVAQQVLRHKSRKSSFRQTYWVTVSLNMAALAAWVFYDALQ